MQERKVTNSFDYETDTWLLRIPNNNNGMSEAIEIIRTAMKKSKIAVHKQLLISNDKMIVEQLAKFIADHYINSNSHITTDELRQSYFRYIKQIEIETETETEIEMSPKKFGMLMTLFINDPILNIYDVKRLAIRTGIAYSGIRQRRHTEMDFMAQSEITTSIQQNTTVSEISIPMMDIMMPSTNTTVLNISKSIPNTEMLKKMPLNLTVGPISIPVMTPIPRPISVVPSISRPIPIPGMTSIPRPILIPTPNMTSISKPPTVPMPTILNIGVPIPIHMMSSSMPPMTASVLF